MKFLSVHLRGIILLLLNLFPSSIAFLMQEWRELTSLEITRTVHRDVDDFCIEIYGTTLPSSLDLKFCVCVSLGIFDTESCHLQIRMVLFLSFLSDCSSTMLRSDESGGP